MIANDNNTVQIIEKCFEVEPEVAKQAHEMWVYEYITDVTIRLLPNMMIAASIVFSVTMLFLALAEYRKSWIHSILVSIFVSVFLVMLVIIFSCIPITMGHREAEPDRQLVKEVLGVKEIPTEELIPCEEVSEDKRSITVQTVEGKIMEHE